VDKRPSIMQGQCFFFVCFFFFFVVKWDMHQLSVGFRKSWILSSSENYPGPHPPPL
jgi:hypothetical protein